MTIIKGARKTPEDYDLIERGAAVPAAADMCIIHGDDTMEPYIRRGERVYISRRQTPAEMEAGLFLYRGKVYCRQWCEDYAGGLHLLCANPARERENLHLSRSERRQGAAGQKAACAGIRRRQPKCLKIVLSAVRLFGLRSSVIYGKPPDLTLPKDAGP